MATPARPFHLIGNDDASRNQWCSRLGCTRAELEAAIGAVGPSAVKVRMKIGRLRLAGAARNVASAVLLRFRQAAAPDS